MNIRDLICLSGATYETREYSGVVVKGKWIERAALTDTDLLARVERTLASEEIYDAPFIEDAILEDGITDYYYELLPQH